MENKYQKKTLPIAKLGQEVSTAISSFEKHDNGEIAFKQITGRNDVNIMCTGQIDCNLEMVQAADMGDFHNYRPVFKNVRNCFKSADLVIGNPMALMTDEYPDSWVLRDTFSKVENYANLKSDFADALNYAGFNLLAMANPFSACAGADGIFDTVNQIENKEMFSTGIAGNNGSIVNINGMRIGVLSLTTNCYKIDEYFNEEGKNLVGTYSAEKAKKETQELKSKNAEFILVYLNCGDRKNMLDANARLAACQEIAEAGADYIVTTTPDKISKFTNLKTSDGRVVPMQNLNKFSGEIAEKNSDENLGVILNIHLFKEDNGIVTSSSFVPYRRTDTCKEGIYGTILAINDQKIKKNEKANLAKVDSIIGSEIRPVKKSGMGHKEGIIPQLTYGEIFDLIGEPVYPKKSVFSIKNKKDAKKFIKSFTKIDRNDKPSCIANEKELLRKSCIAINVDYSVFYKRDVVEFKPEDAVKKRASILVDTKPNDKIPTIVVERPWLAYRTLVAAIKSKYSPITVAITGTSGKTTTKELICSVFNTHYNTLYVNGNYNSDFSVGKIVQKLTPEHEAYIQEVHGGTPGSARKMSNIINPDISIITNVGDGHLSEMGTMENVLKGKLAITSNLKKDGVLLVDDDNEYLHDINMECKVIKYSLENSSCDYYAEDINDMGDAITFTICCNEGKFPARLNFQGLHNVRNALAAFASGRIAGIPAEKIITGIASYTPKSDKQRVMNYAGYKLIIDSYSITSVSAISAIKGLENYPVEEGGRRIACYGDIPGLGKKSEEVHLKVAEELAKYNFDILLCTGDFCEPFAEAARAAGKTAYYFSDREEFNAKIVETIREKDVILFKSGVKTHFKEQTIYPIFGKIV